MSGFIPDLARWALRGQDGDGNEQQEQQQEQQAAEGEGASAPEVLSEQELRARRLARVQALQANQDNAAAATTSSSTEAGAQPMQVDAAPAASKPASKPVVVAPPTTTTSKSTPSTPLSPSTPLDPARKIFRKKEILLRKVLQVSISGPDASCVSLNLPDCKLDIPSISEVLATRLSMDSSDLPPTTRPLFVYLAQAHRKVSEELQDYKRKPVAAELQEFASELQRQLVSYAASCLLEPDLFPQAQVQDLVHTLMDPADSIAVGVAGPASSFYHCLCDELLAQDEAAFSGIMARMVNLLMPKLKKCESLDSTDAMSLLNALVGLCGHKKAALAVAQLDSFLLVPADHPLASQQIRPPPPSGVDFLRMLTGGDHLPYLKRSGPALEKDTLLGLVLRISTPKSNPAFSTSGILRQSADAVERINSQQRQTLRLYQNTCHQLIMALIKGGPDARGKVLQWFTDCMLLNEGATAMRPDPSKVSSSAMLLNASVALLKLCGPFVSDESKHSLILPQFVADSKEGRILFPSSGNHALSRLGDAMDVDEAAGAYAPKNTFVPHVFFLTARSLALGIAPMLASHENLLRHISHQHWEITNNQRDAASDPHFCMLVSRQRSNEVALFEEDMLGDTMRLADLLAKVIVQLPDDLLPKMPEFMVVSICDLFLGVAKLKPKGLRGAQVRWVFALVVKLLSPEYTAIIRNYNLRAMLGNVLYELFLPTVPGDRRDVPSKLCCDPMAGGQTYLLADAKAQTSLAPSLLLLYGEVEHTGYYDKMSHRAKIMSVLKYLWESTEHRPAFRKITQDKESFIKFANGIINETNTLLATVMQKLPEIRTTQEQMASPEWGQINEEERNRLSSRLEENEREVKHALPLCNKTLSMFGYLNTDPDIRSLFMLEELYPRLVNMLLHVLGKLVGSKGMDLKVENPEQYEFRPKEMLRDLCAIFALFASYPVFYIECAKSGCDPNLLRSAVRTCQRLHLLGGESMTAFASLPDLVAEAARSVADDEALMADAPDEFLDEILSTFMVDPVILPSGHFVDRSTITQHLLNDPIDPFNREEMTINDVKPATELKARIEAWLAEKRAAARK
eukprot:Nitzschia sp. Nitz4//scaffold118_size93875//62307//65704//NITZ4_004793-RA/size93875-augustus-gene-0.86-mRNA-1//1//CDS//3329533739//5530//frame0